MSGEKIESGGERLGRDDAEAGGIGAHLAAISGERCLLDGLEDAGVAGAATEVSAEAFLNL